MVDEFLAREQGGLIPCAPNRRPGSVGCMGLGAGRSPFPPSGRTIRGTTTMVRELGLCPSPRYGTLARGVTRVYNIGESRILIAGNSSRVLGFTFVTFYSRGGATIFPSVACNFCPIFTRVGGIPFRRVPLGDSFAVGMRSCYNVGGGVFVTGPGTPANVVLDLGSVRGVLGAGPSGVIIVSRTCISFNNIDTVPLVGGCSGLLIARAFSGSHSVTKTELNFNITGDRLVHSLGAIGCSAGPCGVGDVAVTTNVNILRSRRCAGGGYRRVVGGHRCAMDRLGGSNFSYASSCTGFVFTGRGATGNGRVCLHLGRGNILVHRFRGAKVGSCGEVAINDHRRVRVFVRGLQRMLRRLG